MFVDPQLHLYATLVGVIAFYLIPRHRVQARALWLVVLSVVLVFYSSPYAVPLCALSSVVGALCVRGLDTKFRQVSSWLGIAAPLTLMLAVPAMCSEEFTTLARLGLSYFALKSVSVVIDARRSAVRPGLLQIFLLNFFYPAYSAGPIDRAKTFADKELASAPSVDNLWNGLQRVVLGIFKVNFVVGKFIVAIQTSRFDHALDRPGDFPTQELWLAVMLAFVSLYVSFSGYTDIAVGTARLFGIRLRENFDNPLFANSIQNFWQRWHRSLAGFVADYVFLPLVRATGNPYLGIFVAFFLAGLWHELTINYVIWGSLHGAALALNMRYSRTVKKYPSAQRLNQNPLVDVVCRVLTLGFVAWLSAFANRDSLDVAWALTRALLGLQ